MVSAADYARRNDATQRRVTLVEANSKWQTEIRPWLAAEYRSNGPWAVDAQLARLDTAADAVVRHTVRLLFLPVRLGVRVPVAIGFQQARTRLGWRFGNEDWEGTAWAGMSVLQLSARYAAPGGERQTERATAGLPALGATLRYRLEDKLLLHGGIHHAALPGAGLDAALTEAGLGIEWRSGGLLFGAGWRQPRFTVDLDRPDYTARAALMTRGAQAYVGWAF